MLVVGDLGRIVVVIYQPAQGFTPSLVIGAPANHAKPPQVAAQLVRLHAIHGTGESAACQGRWRRPWSWWGVSCCEREAFDVDEPVGHLPHGPADFLSRYGCSLTGWVWSYDPGARRSR